MTGRRADDLQEVVVRSGRRSSDVVKTFGWTSPAPKKKSSFFSVIGWMVLIFVFFVMCGLCSCTAWLFS